MSLSTITISTVEYVSYASVSEADQYLAVDPVRGPTWAALTNDQKGQRLVAATRRLDRLNWAGRKTGGETAQANAFPRTDLAYPDGTAVPDDEVPREVEEATILLAGTIALTPASANVGSSATNTRRVKAGSAEVEFFRPTAGKPLQDETAWALVRIFLDGSNASGAVGMVTFGGKASDSQFDVDPYGLTEGYP